MIVWKSLVSYLNENLRSGKSINVKRFGTFTFDIHSELPRIATKTMNPSSDLED
jgi:nucleoid DNA-binding protein